MKKFRVKRFVFVFLILMLIQFLVALADISLYQSDNALSSVTSTLMSIFSMPIGLINQGLPFYINEDLPIKVIFWIINLFLQTAILLGGMSLLRSIREKLKH